MEDKYYRFKNGAFVKAESFEEAKRTLVDRIESEVEDASRWHDCTCLGFQHKTGCPQALLEGIPF